MEVFNDDGIGELTCEVRIGEGSIVVSYEDANYVGIVVYEGSEVEPGHFKLTRKGDVFGRATLHRFKDGEVFDGWYVEDGYEGMWRVHLEE
jgi:hypothetical protein